MGADAVSLEGVLAIITGYVGDALIDTLQVIPFLFVTYLLLEFIEHRMSEKAQLAIKKSSKVGPLIGAALGIVPQCGFSSAASTFYAGRVITIGTLFSVYLTTSDEMIPIFIAGGMPLSQMLLILGFKFFIGIIFGFAIDLFMRAINKDKKDFVDKDFEIHKMCKRDQCSCYGDCNACKENPETVYQAFDLDGKKDSHGHVHDHSKVKILKPAILHTFQVTVFIFLVTFLLNIIIEFAGGTEALSSFLDSNKYMSIFAASIVGLIPNCAASVVISQLYVEGVLSFAALIAGLLDATGVGLIVLFRNNRPFKENILITLGIFIISFIIGLIVSFIIP